MKGEFTRITKGFSIPILFFWLAVSCMAAGSPGTPGNHYGWEAYAFDWAAFQHELRKLKQEHSDRVNHFSFYYQIVSRGRVTRSNADYKKLIAQAKALHSGADPARVENEKKDLLSIMLLSLIVDNPEPSLKVKDFSSIYFTSFRPKTLHSIFGYQTKKIKTTWFRLFKAGRAWGEKDAAQDCSAKPDFLIRYKYPWGYCMDAYFVLSPGEVQQFSNEVVALKSNGGEWIKPALKKEINNLDEILQEVRKNSAGLLFLGRVQD